MTEPFLTRCPHCRTSFRVHGPQLQAADGLVRCGDCRQTFSAPANRVAMEEDTPRWQTLSGLQEDDSLDPLAPDALDALDDEGIEIGGQAPSRRPRTALWLGANLLLVVLLGAQFAWNNLDSLLRDPRLQGLSSRLCALLDCPPVATFELASFHTEDLSVQSHPQYEDALLVNLIFRNAAPMEQPLPRVELRFSDMRERPLASRLFTPQEYLPEDLDHLRRIPANTSLEVELEIVDPGADALNYSLALRAP